jgi:hypothetical protein
MGPLFGEEKERGVGKNRIKNPSFGEDGLSNVSSAFLAKP